jgi:serine/threonine protein phosphatase PrpC
VPQKLAAFSVFDGHYGHKAAKHAANVLLKNLKEEVDSKGVGKMKDCLRSAFAKTDEEILDISEKEDWTDGSTGLCAIVEALQEGDEPESVRIWLANAGDCRAVIYRSEGKFEQVTVDHGTQNQYEQRRIVDAGGSIIMGRIEGRLNVARGFGDRPFKVRIISIPRNFAW